jgi:hypothetical protein
MWRLALASLVFATLPAVAATPTAQPKGSVTAAADGRITLAAPDCAASTAGYVPGVDVEGRAVVPADLPASDATVKPETAAIELDARLAAQFGVHSSGARVGRTILGYVTVRDRRAYFNGQPLAPEANDAVIAACRAQK